jgi:hypothetical protein
MIASLIADHSPVSGNKIVGSRAGASAYSNAARPAYRRGQSGDALRRIDPRQSV